MACALGMPVVPLAGIEDLELARGVPRAEPPGGGSREGMGNILAAAALVPGAVAPAAIAAAGRHVSLVLGNEGWGLPDEVVAACDASVVVPMAGNVDSLNVGAAGAILMWELFSALV
jgi:hypothetical protein